MFQGYFAKFKQKRKKEKEFTENVSQRTLDQSNRDLRCANMTKITSLLSSIHTSRFCSDEKAFYLKSKSFGCHFRYGGRLLE